MKKTKISIVIPVYNDEMNLYSCIDSLLCQTYKDFEIVLVDDGSVDNSNNICKQYKEKNSNIKLINIEHKGSDVARNIGLEHCDGDFITFVDSDDYVDPKYLEIMYNNIVSNNCDLCICDFRVVFNHEYKKKYYTNQIRILSSEEMYKMFFRISQKKDYYGVWGKLIKKEVISKIKFVENKINGDIPFVYSVISSANKAVFVDDVLYYYYHNREGITNRAFSFEKLDLLEMWDVVLKDVKEKHPEYLDYCKGCCMRARFTLLSKMFIDGYDKNNKELYEINCQLKQYIRKNYFSLLKLNMSFSRKVLLTMLLI